MALVRADGSVRAAYEITVTSRNVVTFIREVARAGIRVREAVADPAWLDGVLRESDTWNEAVATIWDCLTWNDLWHGSPPRLAVCDCGNRKPSSRNRWCRRCEKARTCPDCGGPKKPGYSKCYDCHEDDGWRTCDCGKPYNSFVYNQCYECGYIDPGPDDRFRP